MRKKKYPLTKYLSGVEPHESVSIDKKHLKKLPKNYEKTSLGEPLFLKDNNAIAQYRGPYKRHVIETKKEWFVHKDYIDPRKDKINHIISDSPETLVGAGIGLISGMAIGKHVYNNERLNGKPEEVCRSNALFWGATATLFFGTIAYLCVKDLKN
jgi:hypothetical protein